MDSNVVRLLEAGRSRAWGSSDSPDERIDDLERFKKLFDIVNEMQSDLYLTKTGLNLAQTEITRMKMEGQKAERWDDPEVLREEYREARERLENEGF